MTPPLAPAPYLVGETGPALFVPARRGNVVAEPVTVKVSVSPEFAEAVRQSGKAIAAAVNRSLQRERLRGN